MKTKLYEQQSIKRKFFGLKSDRPKAGPHEALVLTGKGGTVVLLPDQSATPGEAFMAKYDTVFRVNMGVYDITTTFQAPAEGGDVSFTVTFSTGYRVSDPSAVVKRKLEDPASLLVRSFQESISQITSSFDIEKGADAAKAIREAMVTKTFVAGLPFVLEQPHVQVDLDSAAKAYLSQKREQRRQADLTRASTSQTIAEAEKRQLEQEYELRAREQEAKFQMEMEKRRVEMELQVQQMRLEVYKPMIEGGMWALLMQQLAQNPDDIGKVTDVIMTMHGRKVEADLLRLKTLIDGDVIDDAQIKRVTDSLIQSLEVSMLTGGASGTPRLTTQTNDKTNDSEQKRADRVPDDESEEAK